MRVLFFTAYPVSVHLYTYLELIANHMQEMDDVHVITCNRELETCFANRDMVKGLCEFCVSGLDAGLKEIGYAGNRYHLNNFLSEEEIKRINSVKLPPLGDIEELQSIKIEEFDVGYGIASSLISYNRDADICFDDERNQIYLNSLYRTGLLVYQSILAAIDQIKPDRVYVFNGRFVESRACMRAAEARDVDFIITEVTYQGKKYRLFENALPHDIAYRTQEIIDGWKNNNITIEEKRRIARSFFENKRSGGAVNDRKSYVLGQKPGQLPRDWDSSFKNVVIFNSSEDEFASIGPEWKSPVYPNQVLAIDQLCDSLSVDKIRIYLRVHPNLDGLDNEFIKSLHALGEKHRNLIVIPPNSPVSTYSLIDAANIIVTFGSTVGVEASYWRKPVILLGKSFYYNLDVAYIPNTHEEAIALIRSSELEAKSNDGAMMIAYHWMTEGILPIRFEGVHGKARYNNKIINGVSVSSILRVVLSSGIKDYSYFINRLISYIKLRYGG